MARRSTLRDQYRARLGADRNGPAFILRGAYSRNLILDRDLWHTRLVKLADNPRRCLYLLYWISVLDHSAMAVVSLGAARFPFALAQSCIRRTVKVVDATRAAAA
jgi:hypothetical protein